MYIYNEPCIMIIMILTCAVKLYKDFTMHASTDLRHDSIVYSIYL